MGRKAIDLTGAKIGYQTVLRRHTRNNEHGLALWVCLCECGNESIVPGRDLRRGKYQSCGCKKKSRKHGWCGTPEYKIWAGMITRCHNTGDARYVNYGGKGIEVCDEWRESFSAFISHVGPRPPGDKREYSIERIDNTKGYEPGNVKWATHHEQSRNRSDTTLYEFRGETKCLKDWAEEFGVSDTGVASRLEKGWSLEESLTLPNQSLLPWKDRKEVQRPEGWSPSQYQAADKRSGNRYLTFQGKTQCVASWARETGLAQESIRSRLRYGWSVEDTLSIPNQRDNRPRANGSFAKVTREQETA